MGPDEGSSTQGKGTDEWRFRPIARIGPQGVETFRFDAGVGKASDQGPGEAGYTALKLPVAAAGNPTNISIRELGRVALKGTPIVLVAEMEGNQLWATVKARGSKAEEPVMRVRIFEGACRQKEDYQVWKRGRWETAPESKDWLRHIQAHGHHLCADWPPYPETLDLHIAKDSFPTNLRRSLDRYALTEKMGVYLQLNPQTGTRTKVQITAGDERVTLELPVLPSTR